MMNICKNDLRCYIRSLIQDWHENLDMVMASNNIDDKDKDEDDINSRDPKDPYGNSFETRGKRPKPLETSNAFVHQKSLSQKAGVGKGTGPQSGRFPGGKTQGIGM